MTQDNKSLWFKNKTYGWGWTPATWQGWVVVLVFLGLMGLLAMNIDEKDSLENLVFSYFLPLALMLGVLFLIAYKKGEKPRWQWGDKDKK